MATIMISKGWRDYDKQPPEPGVEVWAYHDEWIDDCTPNGIRIGTHLQKRIQLYTLNYFVSAAWNNETKQYYTHEQNPQAWKLIKH